VRPTSLVRRSEIISWRTASGRDRRGDVVRQMRQTRRRGETDAHEGGRRAGTAPEAGASGEAVAGGPIRE
jgi:hypothetical protein